MNRGDFQTLMEDTFLRLKALNKTKGHDYAGDKDALANFKSAAQRLGLSSEQVWAVYADKHWSAIMTFCKEGQVESEPIEGRIDDAILYLFLLKGMVAEKGERARSELLKIDPIPGGHAVVDHPQA
jgi:hypothetical protein